MSLFLQLELDYVSAFLWSRDLPQFGRRPPGGPNCILEGSITPQLSDEVLTMLKVPVRLDALYCGSWSGGEGGGLSRLRLPKDGGGGLPKDVTDRRPDVGEGEGWMWRGGPTGSPASPGAGGGGTDERLSKRLAWWSAALCLRRALAAAPR